MSSVNLTGWITNFTPLRVTRLLIVSVHDTMPVPGANIQTKYTRINCCFTLTLNEWRTQGETAAKSHDNETCIQRKTARYRKTLESSKD